MLANKKILIISPQRWGRMHLIKHHYAIDLANRGNEVYFLNPPDLGLQNTIEIAQSKEIERLHIITYKPSFPLVIRFRLRWLYDWLMGYQIRSILEAIGKKLDIVWCFDLLLYSDLKRFQGGLTIFHVGDMLYYDYQNRMAATADIVFSVAAGILTKLEGVDVPKYFINHGLSEEFEKYSLKSLQNLKEGRVIGSSNLVKIGYVGNVLRPDIDHVCFRNIVEDNKGTQFYLWGPTTINENNVAAGNYSINEQVEFVDFLKGQDNVVLSGVKEPDVLAQEMQEMDGFLICYDIDRDQSKGTNYHKIIEYISTGKVVISNNVSTYANRNDLVQMPKERNNQLLGKLMGDVVKSIEYHNSDDLKKKRLEFALDNTYRKQINRIDRILSDLNEL